MDKAEIKLSFDSEKMEALAFYLKRENSTVQKKMDETMRQLYEDTVPEPVREYLDAVSAPPRPRRPPRSSQPKSAAPKQMPAPADQGKENAV